MIEFRDIRISPIPLPVYYSTVIWTRRKPAKPGDSPLDVCLKIFIFPVEWYTAVDNPHPRSGDLNENRKQITGTIAPRYYG